jgi:putative ABC transport system permease protein
MPTSGGLNVDQIRLDFRHALRSLLRDRRFTAVVVLTLGVGIGANTAVFSLVRSIVLAPLPYEEPDRLGMVWTEIPARGVRNGTSAYANVEDWRAQGHAFEDLATFDPTSLTLTDGDWPELISTARVSSNFFSVLGVGPAIGRTFSLEEERGRAQVVVLSHDLWVQRFDASPGAIGAAVEIAGSRFEVVGVMPAGFGFPDRATRLWLPQTLFTDWEAASSRRGTDAWRVVGRLRPDASFGQARSELAQIAARLEQAHPAENAGLGVSVVPLYEEVAGHSFRLALWTVFGAVGLVLLIACANAAHLILARGMDRGPELALRRALGATSTRLARNAITENLVIAALAWVVAVLLAVAGIRLLLAVAPASLPRLDEVRIDAAVLFYSAAVSLGVALLFGSIPFLSRSGPLFGVLREAGGRRRRQRARSALIVLQFALAIVLVFGANLLIASFLEARRVEPGFASEDVWLANLSVEHESRRTAFYAEVLQQVQAVPGVSAVGLVEDLFISGAPNRQITVDQPSTQTAGFVPLRIDAIAGDFFRSLDVSLLEGRTFSGTETPSGPPVAIVNETMARRFWPGESPIGKRFRLGGPDSQEPWIEIVGLVGDIRRQGPELDAIAQAFRPYAQEPSRNMNLLIRSEIPMSALASAVRARIADIDRTVPLYQVRTVDEALHRYVEQRQFQAFLLGLFSVVAVLLAAVGIYGLMAHSVARRTREIGVRIALGASSERVLLMILRQGLSLAALGVAAGMGCALWLSDALSALLFHVSAFDARSVIVTSAILVCAAVAACYAPARRAATVHPVRALRAE